MKTKTSKFTIAMANPADPAFRMDAWPFYWLAKVSRRYSHDMDVVLKRVGMDVARWRVLMILTEIHPASVSDLADHAVLKLPTMTKTVQRMEIDRLVRTDVRPTDARVTEVFLTDAGREAIASVRRLAGRVFDQAFDGFAPSELEALNVTLRRIFANLANIPD